MEIGTHCSFPECKQLDFLPFRCPKCLEVFCSTHRFRDAHNCRVIDEPTTTNTDTDANTSKLENCDYANCSTETADYLTSKCPGCSKVFCLQHRHGAKHECTKPAEELLVKEDKRKQIQEFVESKLGTSTSSSTKTTASNPAPKRKKLNPQIELIKMKAKAKGETSVPIPSRIYLRVYYPSNETSKINTKDDAMFFDKSWTIGRILDKICAFAGIVNVNNTGDASRRLSCLDLESGNVLDMDAVLGDLVAKGILVSGGTMSIERGFN